MSITTARNFIEKTGCGLFVGIVLAVVFAFGIYAMWGGGGGRQQNIPQEKLQPIATIGTKSVSANAVERHFRNEASQQLNQEGGAPPELEAFIYGSVLKGLLEQTAQLELAAQKGIQVDEDDVIDYVGKSFDARVAQLRQQYQAFGLIKPNATEAEIQKTLSQNFGGDIGKARTQMIDQAKQALQDPNNRSELYYPATAQKLLDSYIASTQLSDEDLKKAQYTTTFKRISFMLNKDFSPLTALQIKQREEEKLALAQKALAEIKGGLSFEAAMEKYSDDTAPQGKKKSETTVDLQNSVLTFDPDYKKLIDLKPGEVSPVIFHNAQGQYLIFKAVKTSTDVPKDFETKKADYRKNRINQLAALKLREDTDRLTQADKIKWDSPGYKALNHWFTVYSDMDLLTDKAKRLAEFEKVAEEAKAVTEAGDDQGMRAASLARFVSLDRVYDAAPPEKKKELMEAWVEAASAVLEESQSADLKLEVARTYFELKKNEEALASLNDAMQATAGISDEAIRRYQKIVALRAKLQAAGVAAKDLKTLDESLDYWKNDAVETLKGEAEGNTDYTETGRTKFGDLNKQLAKLQSLGLIKPEDVKAVQGFQNTWKVEKAKYDEEQAAERKKAQEEAKKAAEDAKKKADEAKKNPPTGSTIPAPSGTSGTTGTAPGAGSSNDLTKAGGG